MATPDVAGAGWDEAQCTTALAHLEQLQAQIDNLRLAIPRVIEPFQRPPNPSTFKLFAQGLVGSQNDVKLLKEQWRAVETQLVFEHAKKSFAANTDLSASKSTPSHGWTEREKERSTKRNNSSESLDESRSNSATEDVPQILVEFQKAHPSIKLETQDDNRTISTQFVSGSFKLRFRIVVDQEANGKHKFSAECLGASEPWLSINRCIASRPQANCLKYLLDMVAAYKTVKGTSCAKCKRLLDDTALTPTARRSKQVDAANDTIQTVWEAVHESCLG
ncbi:mediator complex subunit 27-domain-containing protein [Ampelomyces quisqualis]|uniref:Mediator complex subunit 27-domain-containing protein n=1 Tax=Ampelomyces quisqualis TaxID=50730 RepID=A0A6A5R565_AMPQU|nr:mediator complex subunit 27-domain-containing protein [Ampelomyces quisqualis]